MLEAIAAIAGILATIFGYLAWRAAATPKITELESSLNQEFSAFLSGLGWEFTRSYMLAEKAGAQKRLEIRARFVPPIILSEAKTLRYRLAKTLGISKIQGTLNFALDVWPRINPLKHDVFQALSKRLSLEEEIMKMHSKFYMKDNEPHIRLGIATRFKGVSASSELANLAITYSEALLDMLEKQLTFILNSKGYSVQRIA